MDDEDSLSPEVRDQLLATLVEMSEALRTIERLANLRGLGNDWWSIVSQMLVLRNRLQFGSVGIDFPDAMEDLCLVYDAFVAKVLPYPEEH